MFRMWAKEWKENRMVRDITIENSEKETRTHKVFQSIEEICYAFDLGKPIWLEKNVAEFKKDGKTRFYQDSFIEEIEFDYLEIQMLEEDA